MTLDESTARHHGVCPVCEGYGGRDDDDECQAAGSPCPGSCPKCWCPGCHDEETWEAYEVVQASQPVKGQINIFGEVA